jgi:hypothetical protein
MILRRLLRLAGFFLVGTVTDIMVVLYYRAISQHSILPSILLSFMLTIVPLFIAERGITKRQPMIFLSYALGAALGTWLGLMIRI